MIDNIYNAYANKQIMYLQNFRVFRFLYCFREMLTCKLRKKTLWRYSSMRVVPCDLSRSAWVYKLQLWLDH